MSTQSRSSTRRFQSGGGIDGGALVVLLHLLVLPVYALTQLVAWMDWRLLTAIPLTVSLFTFLAFRSDKRRAEFGTWRIPESMLHLAELIGGWPGAFLGQRSFRHKTVKISYQIVFWLIVTAHQFVALDFVMDWRFSKDLWYFVQTRIV